MSVELIEAIGKWIVFPICGLVFMLYVLHKMD